MGKLSHLAGEHHRKWHHEGYLLDVIELEIELIHELPPPLDLGLRVIGCQLDLY